MTRDEIRKAIDEYLSLVEGSKGESLAEREVSLRWTLDCLAMAYYFSAVPVTSEEKEAPAVDWQSIYRTVGSLFPNYGYYNTTLDISINVGQTDIGTGDAIDDISDIAADMYEVRWLWDNASAESALWQFHWGYENHWGDHLRNLQLYLKASERGI